MCRHQAGNKNDHADCKRMASNPKQLVEVALNGVGPVCEITMKGRTELFCGLCLSFSIREMNNDLDRLLTR